MNNLFSLAASAEYVPNALSLATLCAAATILLLGTSVVIRGRGRVVPALFFVITFVAAGWLGAFAAMYAATDERAALVWARLGYVFGAVIPAAVFQFAAALVGRRGEYRLAAALFWTASAGIAAVAVSTDLLIPGVRHFAWGYYPAGRPFGGLIFLGFTGMIVASIHLFYRSYRTAAGRARERAGALLLSFVLGSLGMFDYVPSAGVDLQPIGYFAALAFVIVAATAVWRFDLTDDAERNRAERELQESEQRYRVLFERNLAGVYRNSADGRILDCNEACARILGYASREELLASSAEEFYFDRTERDHVLALLRDQRQLSNLEQRMRRRDGEPIWVLENVTLLEGDTLEGTLIDITDRKLAHERIEYQAYHDALTGLPNRVLFRQRVVEALARARQNGSRVAAMFLDLDQFKLVNDTLGHTAGDRLLQIVAERIARCVGAADTVARMGGDEFTILLNGVDDDSAAAVARRVLDAVRQVVVVEEHTFNVSTSIGIAVFPRDGDDAESLLKNADKAMYAAKEQGRDTYEFASPSAPGPRLPISRSPAPAEFDSEVIDVQYRPPASKAERNDD